MAVNQVSLLFYPLRWRQQLTPDPRAMTDEGNPVQITGVVRVDDPEGPAVLADALKQWLAGQGFTAVEWGRGNIFERGNVMSIFGSEKEIEISVGDESGELTHLYCRFTLPRRTSPALSQWAEFVAALCDEFDLRLEANEGTPCGEAEFLTAVRDSRNYRDFAASFGWPMCEHPFRITIQNGVVLVDQFSAEIGRYLVYPGRELPIVSDAVGRLVDEGYKRFVFDLRGAPLHAAYPIAIWGALYGAFDGMRRKQPQSYTVELAKNIKLVGSGKELFEEITMRRFDRNFECFATTEEAMEALRRQSPP